MGDYNFLSWFYWDPPKEAFFIPIINHPIVWYGVLFVSGFILAYFMINPIWARFLKQTQQVSSLDILNWKDLIHVMEGSSSPLVLELTSKLSSSFQSRLKQRTLSYDSRVIQNEILAGLNQLLKEKYTRDDLQKEFGKALASLKQTAFLLTDRLCWFVVAGTIIGARLGLVFFYDWPYFHDHPIEIFKIWHGGLASHGGFIGVIISLYLFLKYIQKWLPQLIFLKLVDIVVIPTTLVCCFIRLGNFVNQEILGTPTNLPWGIVFGHPADGSPSIPRHPIQLYEAFCYFITFLLLWVLWKQHKFEYKPGAYLGLAFVIGFGTRFILEFWKATQDSFLNTSFLQMGQILSIPFIIIGALLILLPRTQPTPQWTRQRKN